MPTTVRTISRLYLVIAALLLIVGALVISLSAFIASNRTASCVNVVLGERATATGIEQNARYLATVAERDYLLGKVSKRVVIVRKDAYVVAQDRAAAYRAAHPAGRC